MPEWVMKYADPRGQILQQTFNAASESELRDKYAAQGYLVYWIKPRAGALAAAGLFGGAKKLNLEKFLIFNQQFVTLIRAGLPILKGLDLLADRLTDAQLGRYIKAVRDEVKNGTLLSDAFRMQGIFPRFTSPQ
jgi:type IV pilus assembly protein PilC